VRGDTDRRPKQCEAAASLPFLPVRWRCSPEEHAQDDVPRARPSSMAAGVVLLSGQCCGGADGEPLTISYRWRRRPEGQRCVRPFRASQHVHPRAPPSGGNGGAGSSPSPEHGCSGGPRGERQRPGGIQVRPQSRCRVFNCRNLCKLVFHPKWGFSARVRVHAKSG
jgi:hypothetical protein